MKNAESLAAVTHTHTQLYVNNKFSQTNDELVGFLYPKIMVKTRVYD